MSQLKRESDEWWTNFITRAPLEPLINMDTENGETNAETEDKIRTHFMDTVNPKLVKSGQDYFARHLAQMMFSLTVTALMGFSVKSTTAVLLRNSNFLTDQKESIIRNLRTLRQVFRWFNSPDFSMEKALENQLSIRRIHLVVLKKLGQIRNPLDWSPLTVLDDHGATNTKAHEEETKIAAAIRNDLAHIDTTATPPVVTDYYPAVPLSQFNMVCTQASGFAFAKMHAKMFGLHVDQEGADGLLHSWAMAGQAMGIKDCYNIALHDDRFNSELSQRYIDSIVLGGLKSCDTTTIIIHKNILEGALEWAPIPVSYKGLMFMCLSEFSPEFEGTHLKKLMGWWDYFWILTLRLSIYLIANYSLFQFIASHIHEWLIFNAFRNYLGRKAAKII